MLPYINVPFAWIAGFAGASVDEVKLLSSLFISYPLAGILKRIPDSKPQFKNAFIVAMGLFYLVGLFDLWSGLQTIFITSAGAYAIAYYIDGPYMPWIGFVFLMGHMAISHIERQTANAPSNVDVTGAQMVMVMKLTGFCWNVYDGRQPEKDLADFQKIRAIRQMPGLLDYAAYVLFFPSLLVGPAFDYADYRLWIETTMFEVPAGTDPSKAPRTRKQRKIPRSGTPAAFKAVQGVIWVGLFMYLSGLYNVDLLQGDQYLNYGFLRRVWNLHMVGFVTRMKYYGVWFLAEGSCVLSGLGFKGVDPATGKVNWNRLQNVEPFAIETAQNSRGYLEGWNMNTNKWLRNYVYLRVTPKGKKPGFRASLATFTTSAFWHGFYPGYYMAFVLAAFIQTVAKNFRRLVRPFFLQADGQKPTAFKRYYDIASWLATQLIFSFAVAPFVILELKGSLEVWRRVYFYGIIGTAASMAFFASPARAVLVKQLKARQGPRPAAMERTASNTQPILGMPSDPEREITEAILEIKEEVEARRRQGSVVTMPQGDDLKAAVRSKLEGAKSK